MAWIALLVLLVGGLAVVLLGGNGMIGDLEGDHAVHIVALVALLIFIGGGVIAGYRGRFAKAVKDAALWVSLMLALVLAYSFKDDLANIGQRVAGELIPGVPISVAVEGKNGPVVQLRREVGGHFVARTRINGAPIDMMIDTGASAVVLRLKDARRAGIDTSNLNYSIPVDTANGRTMAAPLTLQAVAIGPLGVRMVDALIAQPGVLRQSLLGMSFLNRLRSYSFSKDRLELRG